MFCVGRKSLNLIYSPSKSGWAMVTITIFTVLSGIVALIGALIDGISWNMLDHTRACYSPYEGEFYGQSAYYTDAGYCSTATVGDTSVKGYCYCVQASNILCYRYILADDSNSDCGDILDEYTTWLHISTIICSVLVVGITLYTIFLCVGGVSTIIKGGSVNTQPHYEPASAAYAEPLLSPIEGTPVYQDTVIQGTVVGSFPAPQNPAYDPYNNKT